VSAVTTPADHPGALGWSALLERLRARLGDTAVTHWQPQSTHVPDAMQVAGVHQSPAGALDRPPTLADALLPTWLSPTPLPLTMRGHRPCYQGELELLAGPQRLEQAHWPSGTPAMPVHHQETPDRAPVTFPPVKQLQRDQPEAAQATLRDYFVARSPRAGLLWVFRQQAARQGEAAWFLHGWFA
jgi:protein ImuB